MAAHSQITVKDLAEEAGLPLQCLNKTFREEDAHLLAEFCYPWESIAYHLKLTKADIYAIKNDKDTAELKRIATLETWSEKFAHKATYRVLIEAFIQGNRAKQALNLCKKIYLEIPAITADHSVSDDRCVDLSPLSTDQETNDSCDAPSEELVPDRDTTEAVYQLQMRFICIQNRFLQSGSGTRVTLEQLQTCISTLPSFTSDTPQLLLEATSVNLFTHHLKEYCCALNPDILVGLIEVLGDVETKTMIKEYNRDLRDFECKTKLKDFIGNYNRPTPPDYKEVELKLGDNWGEKTLADVKLINAQISRRSWLVKMVSIGSIYYVTFTIPQMEDVELDDHLKDSLQSQCVLQILVRGLCIFNCEAPSSYKSEQEVVIAIKPKNFLSMLQSTAEELLQVFVKDKFEAMETIKGHILSKLNYFSETLLSNSAIHSSSEAVELSTFTGTWLKSETMHVDPTAFTSNTGKGQLRKRLSLESVKHSHPMGMKRSHSNFDSVGQPSPKVARSSDNKESSRDDETAERAKQSDTGSEEGVTVSIPSEEPSAEEMLIEREATSNSTDKNVIAGVSGDHGVPSESNDWTVGPTIHPTTGASSCVGQDKHSTPATQQQDNRRCGGSSDNPNNTGELEKKYLFTSGILSISNYYHCANNIASVPFIGEVEVLACDSRGCEYWNPDHDITIRIPPDAIPLGVTVQLEVAVALYGPFKFPNNSFPISPILWLCSQKEITFRKPIGIILPHFVNDIRNPGINFAKADHKWYSVDELGMKRYVFKQVDTAFINIKEGTRNYGLLSVNHCCYFCITAANSFSSDLALKAGYCFWCIEKPLSPLQSRDMVLLCATFFLNTCRTALKLQYPTSEGYRIHEPIIFKFQKPEDGSEPYILVSIQDEKCVVAANPPSRKIAASQVYFWNQSAENLKQMHEERIYPPKITLMLELTESYSTKSVPIRICISGAQNELDKEVLLPLGNTVQHHTPINYAGNWLSTGRPEVRNLLIELRNKVAHEWEDLGIFLGIEPNTLDALKTTENNTAQSRLREMLKIWQERINPPPSWSAVVVALEYMKYQDLASDLKHKYNC